MNAEILNKIIKYLMGRPYSEVYVMMDELRAEITRLQNEEVVNGSVDEEHQGN